MVGKIGGGVSDVCFDDVNKSSYFIEQLLHARPRAQHFSSINSFLLLNDAELRTWSPRFTEEMNETLEAQVTRQGHSQWWSWLWGLSRPQLFLTIRQTHVLSPGAGASARCWGCLGSSHSCFIPRSSRFLPSLACSSGSCPGLWKLSGEQRGTSCLSLPPALCLWGEAWVLSSLCLACGAEQIGLSTRTLFCPKQATWILCLGFCIMRAQ